MGNYEMLQVPFGAGESVTAVGGIAVKGLPIAGAEGGAPQPFGTDLFSKHHVIETLGNGPSSRGTTTYDAIMKPCDNPPDA